VLAHMRGRRSPKRRSGGRLWGHCSRLGQGRAARTAVRVWLEMRRPLVHCPSRAARRGTILYLLSSHRGRV
jgi:hypothetical protein